MRIDCPSRELWFLAPREVEVRTGPVPEPAPGRVLARALVSGVSRGTELLLYRGEGPTPFDPSLDPPATPSYPRRYGYAWLGDVIAPGSSALPAGTRVFCLAPHGDLHALDIEGAHPLAATIPPGRAVLAASLETAVTCTWDAAPSIGDEVVVLGAGVVGLLVTWLTARAGARVHVVEPAARRRALALELGAASARHPDDDAPRAHADIVVEASGNPALLDRAIAHAAREASIVVASFYGARVASLSLGSEFHRRRLSLRSSQVSAIPPSRAPRWSRARRFELVTRLLGEACLDALVDTPAAFDRAPDVYAHLDRAPDEGVQTIFSYR